MRYFLEISYLGTDFHGWQIQQNAASVQAEIEEALTTILGTQTPLSGSGRTDTGVHAIQQIAHFNNDTDLDLSKLRFQLNSFLPQSISINSIRRVKYDAHARFDAVRRTYHYRIHREKDPFLHGSSYYFKPELELAQIEKACEQLKKWTDFQCFSKVKTEVSNFECTIFEAQWIHTQNGYEFRISANRFLRGMVRAIVGTLIEVGQNKLSLSEFDLVLRSRDRADAGAAVPPHGLYLAEVIYPSETYL